MYITCNSWFSGCLVDIDDTSILSNVISLYHQQTINTGICYVYRFQVKSDTSDNSIVVGCVRDVIIWCICVIYMLIFLN